MRAEIITDAAALRALEPAWWALFDRSPDAVPFVSPAWLLPWWACFSPGSLHAVAVWDEDRLVGLAPLFVETGPLGRRLLPLGIGLSDLLDVLLDPEHATAAGLAIAAALQDGDWQCWSAEDAGEQAAVLALPNPRGWRSSRAAQSACPILPLPASRDLREAIPARKLRKWRMAQNRSARRGGTIVETSPDTLADDLAALFRLHGARWRARGEAGVLDDPLVRRFHEQAAPALLARGLLRCWVARIDGCVAGVYYGLHRGATSFAYLGGFDPAFAFESPGTVLIGHAIESAAAEGAGVFNFLRGQEAYKYEWGAADRWTWRRTFERAP